MHGDHEELRQSLKRQSEAVEVNVTEEFLAPGSLNISFQRPGTRESGGGDNGHRKGGQAHFQVFLGIFNETCRTKRRNGS